MHNEKEKAAAVAAIRYALEGVFRLDRREPPGEISPRAVGKCECGYIPKREDSGKIHPEWMEKLHSQIETIVPERCRWIMRVMMRHLETCPGKKKEEVK